MKSLYLKYSSDLQSINLFFVFCLGVTLVFQDIYSSIVILALLILSVYAFTKQQKHRFSKKQLNFLALASILIIPRLISFFTGDINAATNELIRALPLVVIPLIFLINFRDVKAEKSFYFGLLSGLILFMCICEYHVISKMIVGSEPLEYFFRWRHLNVNFVEPIGTHPPYVGILIIWVLVKTLYSNFLNKTQSIVLIVVLALFLFQLLARNAMIVALILGLFYSINRLELKYIVVLLVSITVVSSIVIFHPHPYLREKVFYKLNPFDNQKKDKRVSRLDASIEVFKTAPLLGVGPKNDNKLRTIEYKKMNDLVAYENKFNSHNQFFEYLTSNGLLGLICFISILMFLIKFTYSNRDYDNLILIVCFILACLSESVLERSLGIKYFSLLMAFIFLNYNKNPKMELKEK